MYMSCWILQELPVFTQTRGGRLSVGLGQFLGGLRGPKCLGCKRGVSTIFLQRGSMLELWRHAYNHIFKITYLVQGPIMNTFS